MSASTHFFKRSLIVKWLTPKATDREARFRERTIRGAIVIMTIVAVSLLFLQLSLGSINRAYQSVVMLGFVAVATWAVNKQRLIIASWSLVSLAIVYFVSTEVQAGYWLPGTFIAVVAALLLGAMLLPPRGAITLPVILTVLYAAGAFWANDHGVVSPLSPDNSYSNPGSASLSFAIVIFLLSSIGYYLLHEFLAQRSELKHLVETLEDRVAARTRDLGVAAQVSRQITQVLDLQGLLPELTELTRESFDLYHVSIFLYDEQTQSLQLHAGTGEAGPRMVAANKQFGVDDHGLVPLSVRERKPQVINDVRQSPEHQINPFLPNTRSEVALPMLIGDKIIGVLDLQSDAVNKFTNDDIKVFTTLTEQIAVAVRNANLFAAARQASQEAERANQVKSQFLASMSHELRTPLNAILNFTQFVSSGMLGDVNGEQLDMLEKVVHSGKHLLSLINDVLDISKIESGALKLFVETNVDLAKECQSVGDTARSLLGEKPVTLAVDIAPNLPVMTGDKRRIRQIMLNLVSNACKFTETGSVRIALKQDRDTLQFTVQDSGPGIAPQDKDLVFEIFRQTETGLRQGEGTGLGLPISRRLAEAHGGQLWFESTLGQGTTFYLSLPIHSSKLQATLNPVEGARHAA